MLYIVTLHREYTSCQMYTLRSCTRYTSGGYILAAQFQVCSWRLYIGCIVLSMHLEAIYWLHSSRYASGGYILAAQFQLCIWRLYIGCIVLGMNLEAIYWLRSCTRYASGGYILAAQFQVCIWRLYIGCEVVLGMHLEARYCIAIFQSSSWAWASF